MLSAQLKQMGVVGAGGAGFPTYVKAASKVDYVLANGAECEPLLHKDFELMRAHPDEIVSGMKSMMESVGAPQGRFGIKEKNRAAIDAIAPKAAEAGIEMTLLGDFYPSGDEYELVYTATGRLIPSGGIPLQVGCVVNNVETLYNVHQALRGVPVTRKFLTVAGAVNRPCSLWVPIGATFREVLEAAGGAVPADSAVFVGGLMMGSLTFDLDQPVTKTTGGLIVLPRDHYMVTRRDRTPAAMARIGKSACDQCSYCTEFCPRFLLGYDVQPHKVMRSLGFTSTGSQHWSQWGELCCACGLCTLYACPEELYPKEACDDAKRDRKGAGLKYVQPKPVAVHPMKEYRRVPLKMLRQRLKIDQYEAHTPYVEAQIRPAVARILLSQHVGKPAEPVVKTGAKVDAGQCIAQVGEKDLGVSIHASVAGTVAGITPRYIEIRT